MAANGAGDVAAYKRARWTMSERSDGGPFRQRGFRAAEIPD